MAADDCIAAIKAEAPNLSEDEVTELLESLQKLQGERRATAELKTMDERLFDAAEKVKRSVASAAFIERRNRVINKIAHSRLMRFADEMDEKIGNPAAAIEGVMVGYTKRKGGEVFGTRRSVDTDGQTLFQHYFSELLREFRARGVLEDWKADYNDQDIARELFDLSLAEPTGKATDNQAAKQIAEAIVKVRNKATAAENRAGAWKGHLEGYISTQTHDPWRLRDAGPEAWLRSIVPKLDSNRTFGKDSIDDEAIKVLMDVYESLASGVHLKSVGAETDLEVAFKGPGNVAKRISQHRVLHFKDADSALAYHNEFGMRSLRETIVQELERSARNTAMMRAFGTNPEAMFNRVVDELREKHKGDIKKVQKLHVGRSTPSVLQRRFRELDGTTRIPHNTNVAWAGAAWRALESVTKLGQATLSAIADPVFTALEFRSQGAPLLRRYSTALTNLGRGWSTKAKRDLFDIVETGIDGHLASVAARFSSDDSPPGMISKGLRLYFKLNLLQPWTDANQRGFTVATARWLAIHKNKTFDQLPENQRKLFGLYDIDAAKWDEIRANPFKFRGKELLLPDEDVLSPATDLAFRTYLRDRSTHGVPLPDARERSMANWGTQPGDALGEGLRFLAQFKQFPILITRKVAPSIYQMNGGSGLVELMLATTIMGYVAQSAKELAKGRTPRDPTDYRTWFAAAMQGGGAGIYGDFLFGEFNRFGMSPLGTLAGPTVSRAADAVTLFAKFRNGDDVAADAFRQGMMLVPGINLFYTRAALDYLLLYGIQEKMNPGYLRRYERRIKRENDQTFIIPPRRAVQY